MDKASALVQEIRRYCAANADPKMAQKYARYFKEGYDSWGIWSDKHEFYTSKQEAWFEKHRQLGLGWFLALGAELFRSGKYEEGALAIRFVKKFRDEIDAGAAAGLAKWFEAGIGNWAHTDVLCGELLAPRLESGQIELDALAPWRASTFKYQRRAVPVAMLGLLKAKRDVAPLLAFIRPMMLDGERVVHQGLGWFLREAWKQEPKPVEAFLREYKDTAARLIYQYATEKMTPAAKARFRAAKPKKRSASAGR